MCKDHAKQIGYHHNDYQLRLTILFAVAIFGCSSCKLVTQLAKQLVAPFANWS